MSQYYNQLKQKQLNYLAAKHNKYCFVYMKTSLPLELE